ncbi:MAG: spore photoproduct lyase [Bacillota bacterium]|nr:spore photoproduct lyase [Bacillota bacterium]
MFKPEKVIIEEKALQYQMGKNLYDRFTKENIEVIIQKRASLTYSSENKAERYKEGKKTLILGVNKNSKFESCKPSADFQLPLVSGCSGMCEYCYLNTRMGDKPYIKVYVNNNEIIKNAVDISKERERTSFEASAFSDPIPVEPYTNSLRDTITAFKNYDNIEFRFVTKYTDVDSLLSVGNKKTTIRFSVNPAHIIRKYEHLTPSLEERLKASEKILKAGYKLGIIIAPVFIYEGYRNDYTDLIKKVQNIYMGEKIEIEIISHRFTEKGRETTLEIFPDTTIPLSEADRKYKFGQFGYGKYVYKDEEIKEMKEYFRGEIEKFLPSAEIKYII